MLARELLEKCPFWSKEEQKIKSPLKMTLDRVLIWRPPLEEKIGSIYLPDRARDDNKVDVGVILSVGPGFPDQFRFHPTFVKPGWVVCFFSNKLWAFTIFHEGKVYELPYMGERDIKLLIDPEQEISMIGELIERKQYR